MQGSSGPVVRLCCLQIDDHSRLVDLLVEPDVLASWSRPFWNCDAASAIAERSCWKPGSHQTPCWREGVLEVKQALRGNFASKGSRWHDNGAKTAAGSVNYEQIPYAREQGIFCPIAGN